MTGWPIVTGAAGAMGSACATRRAGPRSTHCCLPTATRQAHRRGGANASEAGRRRHDALSATSPIPVRRRSSRRRAAASGELRSLVHTAGVSPSMAAWPDVLRADLTGVERLLGAFADRVARKRRGVPGVHRRTVGTFDPAMDALLDRPLAADFRSGSARNSPRSPIPEPPTVWPSAG